MSLYQRDVSGSILVATGGSPYGNLLPSWAWNANNKTQCVLLDRTNVSTTLPVANHAEVFTLDAAGAEQGLAVWGATPVATIATARQKAALYAAMTSNENTGAGTSDCSAIYGVGMPGAGATASRCYGVTGLAQTNGASLTGLLIGVQGTVNNSSGTTQSAVGNASSNYALYANNAGTSKATAISYALATNAAPATFINGHVVDSASCDGNCFAVFSGASTALWAMNNGGKKLTAGANSAAPAAGAGPFAAGAASSITVQVTGLSTAANATSSAITVNTTAVTASSRIKGWITSYGGSGTPAYHTNGTPTLVNYSAGISAGVSFTFQIYNADASNALIGATGTITIVFEIEN